MKALLLAFALTLPAAAQVDLSAGLPAASTAGASITGSVSLSDTSGPARFAHVLLKRIPDANAKPKAAAEGLESLFSDDDEKPAAKKSAKPKAPEDPDDKAAGASFAKIFANVGDVLSSATVGPTGQYTLTGVKPGSYYIRAVLPGYIDPLAAFTSDQLASTDPTTLKQIRDTVATITILGTESARADLRLELGAAISGHVFWEDGTPAAGWKITVRPYTAAKAAVVPSSTGLGLADSDLPDMTDMLFQETHTTDDRGSYRVYGLPPGQYVIRAMLSAGNSGAGALLAGSMHLTVLSGNVTRLADAKPITLATREDRRDENLTMPMSTLHVVSGAVMGKDGKQANSGTVQLREDTDTSLVQLQTATIQPDGTFRFDYVQNGIYTLKVKKAEVTESTGKAKKIFGMEIPDTKTLRAFGPGEQKITVNNTDVPSLLFSLEDIPVPTKGKKNDD